LTNDKLGTVFSSMPKRKVFASPKGHLVRHGGTDLNDRDVVRGWKDVPLNEDGHVQAAQLAKQLKGKVDVVYSSDLQRARQTADDIAAANRVRVIHERGLRPWDVGKHAGQDSGKVATVLEKSAIKTPDKPLDGGESFNKFKDRFLGTVMAIARKEKGKRVALVTHHRGERVFAAWEKKGMPVDKSVDMKTFCDWKDGIEPGKVRSIG
jgi:broad specificity phosphatase PhoE